MRNKKIPTLTAIAFALTFLLFVLEILIARADYSGFCFREEPCGFITHLLEREAFAFSYWLPVLIVIAVLPFLIHLIKKLNSSKK